MIPVIRRVIFGNFPPQRSRLIPLHSALCDAASVRGLRLCAHFVPVTAPGYIHPPILSVQIVSYQALRIAHLQDRDLRLLTTVHLFTEPLCLRGLNHINLIPAVNSRVSAFSKPGYELPQSLQVRLPGTILCPAVTARLFMKG